MQFQRNRGWIASGKDLNELTIKTREISKKHGLRELDEVIDRFMEKVRNTSIDAELVEMMRKEIAEREHSCVLNGGHWIDNQGLCHECGAKL